MWFVEYMYIIAASGEKEVSEIHSIDIRMSNLNLLL